MGVTGKEIDSSYRLLHWCRSGMSCQSILFGNVVDSTWLVNNYKHKYISVADRLFRAFEVSITTETNIYMKK